MPGDFEVQQRRRKAQAIDADHQARLDLGDAFEEPLVVAGERDAGRDEQERVHGNQDAVELVLVEADQHVLQRREEEKHPEQRAVVAEPRGRERDEFAERPEAHQAEQERRSSPG